jgi:hypothetical protein
MVDTDISVLRQQMSHFRKNDGLNGGHGALSLKILPTPPPLISHNINRLLINFRSVQVMFSCCVCTDIRVRHSLTQPDKAR